jgi:tetratricopeptide (TPR) repeat protein
VVRLYLLRAGDLAMKRTIFLSYSSPQSEVATRIELSLKGEGHSVFRDRTALPPGESFDARIRAAIEESDLLIFLISRESVSEGHYTLTELKFAEQKWGHPAGHVLPVLTEPVPKESIPEFLRAVTMLQPRGDVAAEVVAEVARMTQPWWHWFLRPQGLVLLVLVALLAAGSVWQGLSWYSARREQTRQATALLAQGRLQAESGNYASAWNLLEQAGSLHPVPPEVIDAQERLAMEWLDNARGSQLSGSLKDIADKVSPVLSRGAVAGKGERAADLLAHMGWGDFLRLREGVGGLDPTRQYRRAIEIDSGNVFAHTMWGFEILRKGGPLAEANRHFAVALESKRERQYVRHMQFSALLWAHDPELESEAIRVANEIRRGGETMPAGTPERSDTWRLWNIYYSRLVFGHDKPQFLSALPPADHLATFRWLYPEDQLPKEKYLQYLYMLAQLQEHNGERANALASYRRLQSQLGNNRGMLLDGANAGIKRLSN